MTLRAPAPATDWIREGIYPGNPREGSNPRLEITGTQQPETRALMNWAKEVRFLGSCTLHEVRNLQMRSWCCQDWDC